MADYTDIDVNTLLPGEPWTSAKAVAAFENPQAITEGAVDAPKNLSASLSPSVILNEDEITITNGIGGAMLMYSIVGEAAGAGTITIRYRTSTDSGTTKTSWTTILSKSFLAADIVNGHAYTAVSFPTDTDYFQIDFDYVSVTTGVSAQGMAVALGDLL